MISTAIVVFCVVTTCNVCGGGLPTFRRNIQPLSPRLKSQPRRPQSTYSPPWEPQISDNNRHVNGTDLNAQRMALNDRIWGNKKYLILCAILVNELRMAFSLLWLRVPMTEKLRHSLEAPLQPCGASIKIAPSACYNQRTAERIFNKFYIGEF
jgi:hypothetical protein